MLAPFLLGKAVEDKDGILYNEQRLIEKGMPL